MINKSGKFSIDTNPFFIYILAFGLVLIVYQLSWSYLYPAITWQLKMFLYTSFFVSMVLGIYISLKKTLTFTQFKNKLNISGCLTFIIVGYILEFIYSKQIPIISIFSSSDYVDYTTFGIPTFHVFLTTFTSFFTTYLFSCYLSEKNKKYLFYCLLLLLIPLLIFNRAMLLMNISSIIFVYLFITKKSKAKIYFKLFTFVLVLLMLFGFLGNVRSKNQNQQSSNVDVNDFILSVGQAKPEFVKSIIPKEYFWAYLYISSPLANLQYNITTYHYGQDGIYDYFKYGNGELLFDFISKRLFSVFDAHPATVNNIDERLTVASIYSRSYSYIGWLGIIITFLYLMAVAIAYLLILKSSSDFFATGLAILNTIMLFTIFDNMISFSGLSLQLVFPLIMSLRIKA